MSDRLEELRRQRALQREHLARLDSEIAALEGTALGAERSPPPPEAPPGDSDAEAILHQYRKPAAAIERRTKAGCLLYFAVAIGLLALALAAIYLRVKAGRLR